MNIEEWPVGATHKINEVFTKWVNGVEYDFSDGAWYKATMGWSLSHYLRLPHFNIIECPIKAERKEFILESKEITSTDGATDEEYYENLFGMIYDNGARFTNKP
tara:strand:+ start:409 stop:720 length:312 start_codon:yes stop_codon:yes gene_type:complete